jgi:hypothetical protein
MMQRLLICCMLLTLGLLTGCTRDDSGPTPVGPLIVKDDHGVTLLSVGPLKDGKLPKPIDPSSVSPVLSGTGRTSYHAKTGIINLYAGRLVNGRDDNLFHAAAEIDGDLDSVATDLQPTTVGGQPAVGLRCITGNPATSTTAVGIFHTATGTAWINLRADTAQFDKTWAALTSSMKAAKTVPLKAGTNLRALTHNTKKYRTCKAP